MARIRWSLCRGFLYLVVGLAVSELLIINLTIMYAFISIRSEFSSLFSDQQRGASFFDKLIKVPAIRNMIYEGKSGGFLKLIQNTLERVYIVTENGDISTGTDFDRGQIGYVALDVSSAGEALYLIRRIKQRGVNFSKGYRRLIVDIGANDGLMSSNSFNLIQLGWDAILVEPQLSLLHQAKENIERYADPYNKGKQRVQLVNSLIGQQDGMEDFVLVGEDMESHIFDPERAEEEGGVNQAQQLIVKVPSMTVRTFAKKYNVPKHFAVLSIDAEGIGDKILHQWIDVGFRPAYILYEQLHNKEPIVVTADFMKKNNYRFLIRLGWNYIYEHIPDDAQQESDAPGL